MLGVLHAVFGLQVSRIGCVVERIRVALRLWAMFRNLLIVFGPILGMILLLALMLPQDEARGERPLVLINTDDDSSSDDDEDFESDNLIDAIETAHRISEVVHRVKEQSHEAARRAKEEAHEAALMAKAEAHEAREEAREAERAVHEAKRAMHEAKRKARAEGKDDGSMNIVVDDDDFSFDFDFDQLPKWAAELGGGAVVLIAGNAQNTVRDCKKNTTVAVMGNSNKVTLRKECKAVKVVGNSNVVKFSSAKQLTMMGNSNSLKGRKTGEIYVRGNGNNVRYEKGYDGMPSLDEKGNGNDVQQSGS